MKTFILLTFGFLTFAFYELSGGADFEPASAKLAAATPDVKTVRQVAAAPAPVAKPAQPVTTASITKINHTPDVTRVSLNLTDVGNTPTQQPVAKIIDNAETPQIILPSLIATTRTEATAESPDLRIVSGNRVNVRGGPSTNYGIVSKLTRGEEVQILEDNGNGWVRMQPVDGGESGWMADFLLTSG